MNGERERLVELLKQNCHCKDEDCSNCSSNGICFTYREADYLLDNSVIVPPVKVGQKVYAIATPCGGCKYNNLSFEETLKSCRDCQKREIIECEFDYDLLHEFGETVFPTRAEAEKKLEGMPQ